MDRCNYENLLSSYHDEELDFQSRVEFETHLAGCAICAAHLADLRHFSAVLCDISFADILPAEQNRIHAAVRRQEGRLGEIAVLRMAIPLAALAATVLIVTSTFLVGNIGNVSGAADSAAMSAAASPHSSDWQQVAMQLPSDSRLPAWMVRSLGGDAP